MYLRYFSTCSFYVFAKKEHTEVISYMLLVVFMKGNSEVAQVGSERILMR